jgi:hypothetical protein
VFGLGQNEMFLCAKSVNERIIRCARVHAFGANHFIIQVKKTNACVAMNAESKAGLRQKEKVSL